MRSGKGNEARINFVSHRDDPLDTLALFTLHILYLSLYDDAKIPNTH